MKINLPLFCTVVALLSFNDLTAQGCSDAGFCTIGNLNHQNVESATAKKQKLSLVLANGIGDEDVYVFTPAIQYDNSFNKNWAIQAKLTGNYASGNLGNATALGDIFLSAIYTLTKRKKWETGFLIGTKIPLNNSNISAAGKALPMQYQSSLGTVDFLAGISVSNAKWSFATAIQQPLTGTNGNTFLPAYWNKPEANKYAPTNDFKRKGDVLLRAAYSINVRKKFMFNIGLLGIYHLGRDTYIDGNISNQPIEIKGSKGLTLNGTAAAKYKLNKDFSLGLSGGLPFVVRELRPDGLTRKFVVSPEFIFHF